MLALFDADARPIYGLIANSASAPISAIVSVTLIFGVDYLGMRALRHFKLLACEHNQWLRWQAVIVGAAILASLLYPLSLTGNLSRSSLQILATLLMAVGIAHAAAIFKNSKLLSGCLHLRTSLLRKNPTKQTMLIFWVIFIGLGLLSLAPITDADSLDYHVGVALHILNTGSFPSAPEWFHSRLAGSGEVLIALGLSVGAVEFGALIQFFGVVGLVGILKHRFNVPERIKHLCLLSLVSCPILIAWTASPKPFLLPVAMTSAALSMLLVDVKTKYGFLPNQLSKSRFALICLLLAAATSMKMNFAVSGVIVGSLALVSMLCSRHTFFALNAIFLTALIILIPPLAWKYAVFGGDMPSVLLSPFPGGWPGTSEFHNMLRDFRDTTVAFPASLLIPSGIGTVTTVFGAGLLVALSALVGFRKNTSALPIFAAVAVAVVLGLIGQKTSRFFLESYIWLLLALMLQNQNTSKTGYNALSYAVIFQGAVQICFIFIAVITLTIGVFSDSMRNAVLTKHALGYAEMRWADSVLPVDATVIVQLRSIALAPREAIASDWRSYTSNQESHQAVYENRMSLKNPEFILFSTQIDEVPSMRECNGAIYAGPFHTRVATRNPVNSGAPYSVWIVRLAQPGERCRL